MRICQVELRGFRGVQQGVITLPQHAVLLGPNNVGKSTIVEALALLFGRERVVRPISDWDFFEGSPKPESRFTIIATITDFTDKPETDPAKVPDWFLGERAARPVWWNKSASTLHNEADPPDGTHLAAQVALTGRYEEDTCEFELIRYFFDGQCDPFTDTCTPVPALLLRQPGLFLLSSNREWDKLLSFGSSTLLKVLREYQALPGKAIQSLKEELRSQVTKVEESTPFSEILEAAEKELQAFTLIGSSGKLVYRPTSLDAVAVLQSLVAHVEKGTMIVPVSRQGAGLISLQAFLLLLAFAENRKSSGRSFILAAEEPELHLHPSLHQRLVQRIRGASTQSIVTTQSPNVAAGYQPQEVLFVRNDNGQLSATPLRTDPPRKALANSVKKLYLVNRGSFYEALMGAVLLVPEGSFDHDWLSLWQRVAQAFHDATNEFNLRPITIVPTSDAAVVDTFSEIARFRHDVMPIVDGDQPGEDYLNCLQRLLVKPRKVIRYGDKAAVECLTAWMLEPALSRPGPVLQSILPAGANPTVKDLQTALVRSECKKDRGLHESLAWEVIEIDECSRRACEFFHDVAAAACGEPQLNPGWTAPPPVQGVQVYRATHIRRAGPCHTSPWSEAPPAPARPLG